MAADMPPAQDHPDPAAAGSHPATDGRPRFDCLTGLRGIFALWVVLCHASVGLQMAGAPMADALPTAWMHAMDAVDIAVDGFFMLSGFLLMHLYGQGFAATPAWSLRRLRISGGFLAMRLAKIYPLHLLVLLGYAAIKLAGVDFRVEALGHPLHPLPGHRFSLEGFARHLLLVSSWRWQALNTWNPVAWSISAEWFAYLCFPLLAGLLYRLRAGLPPLLLAIALAAVGVATLSLLGMLSTDPGYLHNDYGLVSVLFFFPAGMLVARFVAADRWWNLPWGALAGLTTLILVGLLPTRWCYWAVPLIPLLVAALIRPGAVVSRLLGSPPLRWLGTISYSLYIVHVLALEGLGLVWGNSAPPHTALGIVGSLTGMTALCLAAGAAVYYLIERPLHQHLRAMIAGRPAGMMAGS
jgi:peptidoglycan/LPS O-acetylase OafA/YrhL